MKMNERVARDIIPPLRRPGPVRTHCLDTHTYQVLPGLHRGSHLRVPADFAVLFLIRQSLTKGQRDAAFSSHTLENQAAGCRENSSAVSEGSAPVISALSEKPSRKGPR